MKPDVAAAWWGAIVSSIVFLWDIYKWFISGARLKLTVAGNMQRVNNSGVDPTIYINIGVRNVGDSPTTITHLVGRVFKNSFDAFRGKVSSEFVISPGSGELINYPYLLNPGTTWSALVPQENIEAMRTKGKIIRLGVIHSMHRKAVTSVYTTRKTASVTGAVKN